MSELTIATRGAIRHHSAGPEVAALLLLRLLLHLRLPKGGLFAEGVAALRTESAGHGPALGGPVGGGAMAVGCGSVGGRLLLLQQLCGCQLARRRRLRTTSMI